MSKKVIKKKIKTGVGAVGFTTQKLINNEGPQTSGIHPTVKVGRRDLSIPEGLGKVRANLPTNQSTKRAAGLETRDLMKYIPHRGHTLDNVFAGRFHKKGKDLHSHQFGISHSSDHVNHYTNSKVRMMKHSFHQPSISEDEYNKQLINAEMFDQDLSIYAVKQPLDISALGQGPLL